MIVLISLYYVKKKPFITHYFSKINYFSLKINTGICAINELSVTFTYLGYAHTEKKFFIFFKSSIPKHTVELFFAAIASLFATDFAYNIIASHNFWRKLYSRTHHIGPATKLTSQ